ncbi:MAG: hypothetical protein ACI9KN_002384, partial [Gammaproteobacteria bacterium]
MILYPSHAETGFATPSTNRVVFLLPQIDNSFNQVCGLC